MITAAVTEMLRRSGLPSSINEIVGKTIVLHCEVDEKSKAETYIFSQVTGVFFLSLTLDGKEYVDHIRLSIASQCLFNCSPIKYIDFRDIGKSGQFRGQWFLEMDMKDASFGKEDKRSYPASIELIKS